MNKGENSQKAVSMRDIARAVGVSVAAVSYALNDREGLISDETRRKILETAKRLDYQPNQLMKAVRTNRTEVIGVLVPSFQTTFFPAIVDAVERALSYRGYHAVMCQTHTDNKVTAENLDMLRQRRVDGLITTPKFDQAPLYQKLVEAGMKIVFIDAHLPELPIPSVQSNDERGSYLAVKHLISRGHRSIATFHQPEETLFGNMRARFSGYCRALKEAGIPLPEELIGIVDPGPNVEPGFQIAKRLLASKRATAFFSPSDKGALGVMRAAHKMGLSIPNDLAVIGYCNQEAGEYTTPRLSTVDQKPGEIGRIAVERLLNMIDGQPDPLPLRHFVEPELLLRESC